MLFQECYKDFDEFFETWFNNYSASDLFRETIGFHVNEFKEIFKEKMQGRTIEDDMYTRLFNKTEKSYIQSLSMDYLKNQLISFEQYFRERSRYKNGMIEVYRTISVNSIDIFFDTCVKGEYLDNYDGLGEYWSYDESSLNMHWGYATHQKSVCIKAKVEIKYIDLKKILLANINPFLLCEETEVIIQKGAFLHDITIEGDSLGILSLVA